jgi:hypothetical protein
MAEDRLAKALSLIVACADATRRTEAIVDPVERRRMQVQIARGLRKAADYLDDQGRLSE